MYDIAIYEPPKPASVEAIPSVFLPSVTRSIAILLVVGAIAFLLQVFIRKSWKYFQS
jgi:hypothetical protein